MRVLASHPFQFVLLSLVVCAVAALAGYGAGIDGMQAVTRYTGRMGLAWFALVFALSPWRALAPNGAVRFAVRRRRQLGLAFGVHHTVHLVLLLAYVNASGNELDVVRAGGGATAYLFLFLMMATSSRSAVRRLGPARWSRLHRTGLWVLWTVFVLTYAGRIEKALAGGKDVRFEFAVFAALLVSLALLRAVAWFSRTPTAAPA